MSESNPEVSALPSPPSVRPPATVVVLGCHFLAGALFSTLSGSLGLAVIGLLERSTPGGWPPEELGHPPPGFDRFSWIFERFRALAAFQTLGAAFSLYAGVRFFQLRRWARAYFEILLWLALAWLAAFGVLMSRSWIEISSTIPRTHAVGGPPAQLLVLFGVSVTAAATVSNAAIPAVLVWLLRSRHVRPAFDRLPEEPGSTGPP